MIAKYSTNCSECGKPFKVGVDEIQRGKKFGWEHVACPAAPVAQPVLQVVEGRDFSQAEFEMPAEMAAILGLTPSTKTEMVMNLAEVPVSAPPVASLACNLNIIDGTYTVVFADGSYRTLRIRTQPEDSSFAPGKRIVSYLNGPDNYANYRGFAFYGDDGKIHVWKKFSAESKLIEAANILLQDPQKAGLAYALESGNCYCCGKKLTVPASICAGLGPICQKKLAA